MSELKCSREISCGYSRPRKIGICGSQSKWETCEAGKLDPQNIESTPPGDELERLIEICKERLDPNIPGELADEMTIYSFRILAERVLYCDKQVKIGFDYAKEIIVKQEKRIVDLESRLDELEKNSARNVEYYEARLSLLEKASHIHDVKGPVYPDNAEQTEGCRPGFIVATPQEKAEDDKFTFIRNSDPAYKQALNPLTREEILKILSVTDFCLKDNDIHNKLTSYLEG